mgnify:CR=1 FL=1
MVKEIGNMCRQAHILIFVEVDVVVRHFIFSGVFNKLADNFDVTFVFPEKGNKRMQSIDFEQIDLKGNKVTLPVPDRRYRVWKWLYLLHQVRYKTGKQAKAIRSLHLKNLGWKAAFIFCFLSMPGVFYLVKRLFLIWLSKNPNDEMIKLLKKAKPHLIIHPCVLEGSYINDLTHYSK